MQILCASFDAGSIVFMIVSIDAPPIMKWLGLSNSVEDSNLLALLSPITLSDKSEN